MYIRYIELENWKCFSESIRLDFANLEIFSFPNGSGKTSILEAIHFGIWGKADYKLETYQNHPGTSYVNVSFDIDNIQYFVKRQINPNKVVLFKENKEFKTGVTEVFNFLDSIIDYGVAKQLWFKGEISDSPVLNFKFFKDNILAEKLKEPTLLYQHYNKLSNKLSRELKTYSVIETRPLPIISAEIAEISIKLKNGNTKVSSNEYYNATQAKEAAEKLIEINNYFKENNISVIDNNTIQEWKRINKDKLLNEINNSEKKITDENLSSLGMNILSSIVRVNEEKNCCVICNNNWDEERKNYINDLITKGFRDIVYENKLKDLIIFKDSISEKTIQYSEDYYKYNNILNMTPNYEEIINKYNSEEEQLWDKFNALNKEKDQAIYNKSIIDKIEELNKTLTDAKKKKKFLQDYLEKATAAYTKALFNKSNEILNDLNSTYSDINIPFGDTAIQAAKDGRKLYITQLSRGEKTLIAISLIYAIRDIFTPGMPLIFDESFSGLSSDNNNKVINLICETYEQLFIVTHNKDWVEYSNYPENTNIRTDWN